MSSIQAKRLSSRASRSKAPSGLEENDRAEAEGRVKSDLATDPAGHHQGIAGHRVVHLRRLVPGNHTVLTEAAVRGLRDDLRGLKENVIVGH